MQLVDVIIENRRMCVAFTPDNLGETPLFSIDASIAYSPLHAAKAVEVSNYFHRRGESLRNLKLEFYRRLLGIREVRKIPFNYIRNEDCNVYLIECEHPLLASWADARDCRFGGSDALEAYRSLLRDIRLPNESRVEIYLIGLVEASKIGKWFIE